MCYTVTWTLWDTAAGVHQAREGLEASELRGFGSGLEGLGLRVSGLRLIGFRF